jgi:DNA-binding GntR family transcriptional regulator
MGNAATGNGQSAGLSSLQAEIARKIIEMIDVGRWQVGDKLSDSQLARELGVSRSPVRQVLQSFGSTGLVGGAENRGFVLARALEPDIDLRDTIPASDLETLYDAIMAARASSEIAEEVSETELVERFSATRGAVRRTLMRMAAEGLVDRRRGHGWQFAEALVTERAVDESYEFRLIVECGALTVPGYRPDPAQLAALRREQTELAARPIRQIERSDWFSANANFHETIVAWSGNRFLAQGVRRQNNLRRMTEFSDFSHLSERRLREACADHLGILEEIAKGDYSFASALLGRHIRRASSDDVD